MFRFDLKTDSFFNARRTMYSVCSEAREEYLRFYKFSPASPCWTPQGTLFDNILGVNFKQNMIFLMFEDILDGLWWRLDYSLILKVGHIRYPAMDRLVVGEKSPICQYS
jgi:hypothetical protein